MRKTLTTTAFLTAVLGVTCATADAAGRLRAIIEGAEFPAPAVLSIAIDGDAFTGADAAKLTLMRDGSIPRMPAAGDTLVVESTSEGVSAVVFKGEITSIEPAPDAAGQKAIVVRGFDRSHRLMRDRRSSSYENKSDADIAAQIAQQAGLAFGASGPEAAIVHARVFQRDQTDLDFLRERAARIGYEVFVDDKTLFFQRLRDPLPITLGCVSSSGGSHAFLKVFHPRTASSNSVSSVTVRGWDPVHHEEIVATARRPLIPLSRAGSDVREPPGSPFDAGFVQALESAAVSYGAAFGTLTMLTAEDLAAEAAADGVPGLRAKARVVIEHAGDAFNGQYVIVGVSHRFNRDSNEGWHTLLRLTRDDRSVYVLPEVGDEVLVAFEHGDMARPVATGSLWNGTRLPPEASPCESREAKKDGRP